MEWREEIGAYFSGFLDVCQLVDCAVRQDFLQQVYIRLPDVANVPDVVYCALDAEIHQRRGTPSGPRRHPSHGWKDSKCLVLNYSPSFLFRHGDERSFRRATRMEKIQRLSWEKQGKKKKINPSEKRKTRTSASSHPSHRKSTKSKIYLPRKRTAKRISGRNKSRQSTDPKSNLKPRRSAAETP